ncbi:MAG TPA: NAD(P)-binding domain-containing protein, partial [Phototrophicaceae bacterium]|nr:NAD(P)-binding domain-containing protein [Phototrophicaceae bacterium]
ELPEIHDQIQLNARVVAISRHNIDRMKDAGREDAPFILHVIYGDGSEALIEARAVIDASGTWHQPNPLGSSGLPAVGEKRFGQHIFYGIPDITGNQQSRYADQRVMVVGSGHSAINALLELAELRRSHPQTTIYWAMRGSNMQRVYGGGEDDALPARGRLGTRIQAHVNSGAIQIVSPFRVHEIAAAAGGINVIGETPKGLETVQVDEIITANGARPDLEMLRELRLELDPSLESTRSLGPMIDPNIHSCGTVRPHGEAELRHPEKDFYIVGMKSYGRAPTFLLATGYEQARSVVAALVGDWEAAREVQLNLPETGVCSSNLTDEDGGCCGSSVSQQPALLALSAIPVNGALLQTVATQPIGLHLQSATAVATATATRDCGCDDTCCSGGVRASIPISETSACGCASTCCS